MPFSKEVLVFLAGLISASFGAGVTFSVWANSHPSKKEIADALGCSDYGSTLEACPAAKDAKAARAETMRLQGEIKDLRRDLSRGFGRALSTGIPLRDEGGKRALFLFQNELTIGVPPQEAFLHVLEQNYP